MREQMSEIVIVSVPDRKEALYIDGKLMREEQWISTTTLLTKLVEWGVIHGGRKYAEESALNDVGQFPRALSDLKCREKRYA